VIVDRGCTYANRTGNAAYPGDHQLAAATRVLPRLHRKRKSVRSSSRERRCNACHGASGVCSRDECVPMHRHGTDESTGGGQEADPLVSEGVDETSMGWACAAYLEWGLLKNGHSLLRAF
jgi:hypothetical protein